MPNWVSSVITISGDDETIQEVKTKLSKPYESPWNSEPDHNGKAREPRTITGDFLLWNIVRPRNLDLYLGREQNKFDEIINGNPDLAELNKPNTDLNDIMSRVIHELATGEGWYEWNCRNWGTKWETTDDNGILESELPNVAGGTTLVYRVQSAWSPPAEALENLAKQYPTISISLVSIDENDCFACEGDWSNGEGSVYDVEITCEMGMELRGYCNLECCNDYE